MGLKKFGNGLYFNAIEVNKTEMSYAGIYEYSQEYFQPKNQQKNRNIELGPEKQYHPHLYKKECII